MKSTRVRNVLTPVQERKFRLPWLLEVLIGSVLFWGTIILCMLAMGA